MWCVHLSRGWKIYVKKISNTKYTFEMCKFSEKGWFSGRKYVILEDIFFLKDLHALNLYKSYVCCLYFVAASALVPKGKGFIFQRAEHRVEIHEDVQRK